MRQIICDICGNVIEGRYSNINLPSMYGGEIVQRRDEDTACDVCRPCARELYNMIEKFRRERKGGDKS